MFPPHEMPYPFETLRHWYVTPFGGRTGDLSPGQVGINARALNQNTDLTPHQDRVLISIVGQNTVRPLYTRMTFEVVALDSVTPDALGRSLQGEAVLPLEEPWDVVRRPYLQPREGEPLLLNSVATKVFGRDVSEVLNELLAKELARRREGRPE